jgi:ubiquinone/menaquinone biosynthesis C-methylase UbiE
MTKTAIKYRENRISHWNKVARKTDSWKSKGEYYHKRLAQIYQFLVPPGQHILEIGCGTGDLLAALKPADGVGIDFSSEMIDRARVRHPEIRFIEADCHDLSEIEETFDVIILSDLVNDLWDVQTVFNEIRRLVSPRTRIIINTYSRLWEMPLKSVQKLGFANPMLLQNWLTVEDIAGLLNLENYEVIRHWTDILWPMETPFLSSFINRYLVKLWPFRYFALTNFIIARPITKEEEIKEKPLVSVIVPARNEAGNIEAIFERTPEMGRGTELVFVEGNSRDDTYEVIEKTIENHPERRCKLFKQSGIGKGDAVRLGFDKADGEILMILDADMTVPPEDLPRFYDAIVQGKCEFANGVRLVYPMEKQAMRYLNLLGNKFFSLAFSWLLGQPIKDTLCGTKVLYKTDYEVIAANRDYFGDFDPFGDFDLIFGAARLNYKIVDIPIRYHERKYGTTNIDRWKHGWLLIKMVVFAASRIKFI